MKPLASALVALCLSCPVQAAPDSGFDGGRGPQAPQAQSAPAANAQGRSTGGGDTRQWVIVDAVDTEARSKVADAGVSIEEITPERVGGIATAGAVERLKKLGIPFTAQDLAQRFHVEDFPVEDAAFHDYARMTAELNKLAASAPGLASVFSIGKSLQGRDLFALRLNTSAQGTDASDKPGILFLGTHHAREHLSTEVPLLLAKHLIDNRDTPEIKALLAGRDVYIVPMVNPDGVEYDITGGQYHMHRKNMRPSADGDMGVDLNRNYGFHWAEGGASDNPGDETYHGPSAFSEPETQAVKAFIESRGNLKVLLSYHTYSELILYPWGYTHDPMDDSRAHAAYETMAGTMAKMTGYTPEQSSKLYIASGDTTDWAWGAHKIFSFTFELTPKSMWGGGFYPGAGAIASTAAANIRPALYLIDLADDPYRAAAPTIGANKAARNIGGR
jgi:carboxypeptidase T